MRTFIVATLIWALTINQSIASVASEVTFLGELAMGSQETKVKGKNAEEMLKKFFDEEFGEDVEMTTKEIDDMSFGDEVDQGFTSTRSAKEMGGFAEGQLEDLLENIDDEAEVARIRRKISNLETKWGPAIERIAKAGAKFGYAGNGPGYCGVSFIVLIIVDPKTSKVYEVYLSESGEC